MNAINWLINKSEVTHHEADEANGWPANSEYFFKGTLPARMAREIRQHAEAQGAKFSGSNTESRYNWMEGETSYSVIFGARKSTANRIRFYSQAVN